MLKINKQTPGMHYTNKLLENLSPEVRARLHLRPVRLDLAQELQSPGQPIRYLVFLESGAASMTTTFRDGSQVEVGLYGYESVIGFSAFMGVKKSLNRVYMQIAGHGFAASIEDGRTEFSRGEHFQQMVLALAEARFLRIAQSAGCNVKHDIEQRLAGWLLTCADRCRSKAIPISQDLLATMLGVRRMSAVVAVGQLKSLGLIDHHRGHIEILDRKGLLGKACECHAALLGYLEDNSEFDHSMTSGAASGEQDTGTSSQHELNR